MAEISELKTHECWVYDYGCRDDMVNKSEADKAIAEQKDKLQNVSSLLKETREWLVESQKLHKRCADNAVKVIRHNKYKRCLTMADACRGNFLVAEHMIEKEPKNLMWHKRHKHYGRWMMLWRCFAEEFKPNSTAQHGKG